MKRRDFLKQAGIAALLPYLGRTEESKSTSALVNDVQTELNLTSVDRVVKVQSEGDVITAIRQARQSRHSISVAGGRHAAGGQQFGSGTLFLDTTSMNRPLSLNSNSGNLEVEAGVEWA